MIISNKMGDYQDIFIEILEKTKKSILSNQEKDFNNPESLKPRDVETIVFNHVVRNSENTIFEKSFELKSSTFFPDISLKIFPYGIEVKSKKSGSNWKTNGNSVLETSRVEHIDIIYLFFCRLISPVEIKYDLYQNCIEEVTVTHSPRYLINMELSPEDNFFRKIAIPYDELRINNEIIKKIICYYKSISTEGEQVWWMGEEPRVEDFYIPPVLSQFTSLPAEKKNIIRVNAIARFPEIIGKSQSKYKKFSMWLVANFGVVSRSARDTFSAGGQREVIYKGEIYKKMPRVLAHFAEDIELIELALNNLEPYEIVEEWNFKKEPSKQEIILRWKELILNEAKKMSEYETKLINSLISSIE